MASELVEFPNDVTGMVLNLEEDSVGCVLFGESSLLRKATLLKEQNALLLSRLVINYWGVL